MRGRDRYDQRFFAVAAAWNIAIALPFLLAAGPVRALLQLPPPQYPLLSQSFFLAVLAFGIGYALVARNPAAHHGVVVVGALVKTAVFLVMGAYWLRGEVGALAMAAPCGDLAFAVLFVEFLIARHTPSERGAV